MTGELDARQAAYDALPAALGRKPDDEDYALADAITDAILAAPSTEPTGEGRLRCGHLYQHGPKHPWQRCILASDHPGTHVWEVGDSRQSEGLREAATPEPTLDAERLAAALTNTRDLWFGGDRDSWWLAEADGMALDIAAEYARLHERTEPQEPGS